MPDLPLILLADAEEATRVVMHCALRAAKFAVVECDEGDAALAVLETRRPDGVILGRWPEADDGWAWLREMRRRGHVQPVVVLASGDLEMAAPRGAGRHRVVRRGAPPARGIAEMQGLLRAEAGPTVAAVRVGEVTIDGSGETADRRGEKVALTATEARLRAVLVRNAGRPQDREHLAGQIWEGRRTTSHAFHSLLRRLRRKLEKHGAGPGWLHHGAGEGYVLNTAANARVVDYGAGAAADRRRAMTASGSAGATAGST